MIRKIFSGQINSITVAAFLVALSSLLSRFLGLFRDSILIRLGASDMLDVYYAAFRIPDLVFNLLVLGALSAGFIPVLTGFIRNRDKDGTCELKSSNEKAWELTSNVLNILGLVLFVLSFLCMLLAPWLMKIIAPGFSPEKQKLTVELTRIMFLSPIFLGMSSVLGGVLQTFKCFFVYSLSPIFYNVGIIFGVVYLLPVYGLHGLAWGVVLGAFLHMIIQLPAVFLLGYRYSLKFDFANKGVRKIFSMMPPRIMSLGVSQINLIVITMVASTLDSGSLTIFNISNNLQSFPIGIFGISFAVAAFPTLSSVAFNKKKLVGNFSSVFRQILFFVVPSTVLLLSLRAQIIRVLYGWGDFDWNDTLLTIDTLGFFTISLFAQASLPLLVRVFYARHDSKTPFAVGMFSALLNVILSVYLSRIYGVAGLALAFSVASIVNFVLLWILLRLEVGYMDEYRIINSAVKFSVSAIACGLAVQGSKLLILPYIDMTTRIGVFGQGLFAGLSGLFVYLAFCSLFRSEELFGFWNAFKRRFGVKKIQTGDRSEARGI